MILRGARLAEHGSWPVQGGWLDQSQAFLDAIAFVASEQSRLRGK